MALTEEQHKRIKYLIKSQEYLIEERQKLAMLLSECAEMLQEVCPSWERLTFIKKTITEIEEDK